MHPILSDMQAKMKKTLDYTLHEFSRVHTGKASPAMVEGVMVEAYGSMMRLKECAAISTPDARMIMIQPWDKGITQAIAKGIHAANLGFNPIVDGANIRVPLPELSRERRQEMVKRANVMAEEGRVQVRNVRREAMDALKKAHKDGGLSEDELKRCEKEVQLATDKTIKDIGGHLARKETEITTL
ncbi:MAG: ribosome recycling factor [Opitutaceae bacterium]|jgi:ribosome recycling factor|nr:ribosome recycling factor [Opitutaceae bacterium]